MSDNTKTFPDGSNGEIPMKPRTRTENFLVRIADNPYAKDRPPKTRKERAFNEIFKALNEVTQEAVDISETSPTITPVKGTIYKCGELTSLTVTDPPETGSFSIIFFSGETPTEVTGIDNFTVEANKRYRIDVQDCYATFKNWPYTPL